MAAVSFFRAHPRLLCLLGVLLAGGAGYTAGRLAHPTPSHIEEKSHVEEKTQAVQTEDIKASEKIAEVKARKRAIKVVEHTEHKPDGTTTTDRTTTVADVTDTKTNTSSVDMTRVSEASNSLKVTDTSKILDFDRAPKWAVRVFGELELVGPAPMVGGIKAVTPLLLYGVTGDRRLWGPFWVGVGGGGTYDLRTRSNGWWAGVSASMVFTF